MFKTRCAAEVAMLKHRCDSDFEVHLKFSCSTRYAQSSFHVKTNVRLRYVGSCLKFSWSKRNAPSSFSCLFKRTCDSDFDVQLKFPSQQFASEVVLFVQTFVRFMFQCAALVFIPKRFAQLKLPCKNAGMTQISKCSSSFHVKTATGILMCVLCLRVKTQCVAQVSM